MLAYLSYDPIVRIHLGPLAVSPHGIMTAVGVLVGAWFVLPRAERRGISRDQFLDPLTWALLGAVVGARLAYVVNHLTHGTGLNGSQWTSLAVGSAALAALAVRLCTVPRPAGASPTSDTAEVDGREPAKT